MTFADLTSVLFENYGGLIVDNLVRQGPGNWLVDEQTALGRLRAHGKIFVGGADGNDRYAREWGVKIGGKTAASFGAEDGYPTATQPSFDDASLGWFRNGAMIDIDNLIRLATRQGAIRGGELTGLGVQITDALKAIVHAIETQLFSDGTGNGGNDADGMLSFLSTSNTYATIAQGGQALWQANIVPGGAAALSKTLLRTLVRNAFNRDGIGSMSEMWMDLLQFQKYATLDDGSIRYIAGQGAMSASVVPHYTDGSQAVPIKVVKGMPTDEVWMLNMEDIEYRFLDHTPDDKLAAIRDEEVMHVGIPIGFERVQTGKDSKAIFAKAYGNLVCSNPYRQSALTGLATTAP